MITIPLLEADDRVDPEDWCRPLSIRSMSGGHSDGYSFQCQYSSKPENNAEWVQVKYILGKPWHGKTVKQIDKAMGNYVKYEYARGLIPHPVIACGDELQKFAELIVKECMRLNSKELSITAIERLLPLYQEHFGVAK